MRSFSVAAALACLVAACGPATPANAPASGANVTPAALCDHLVPLIERMKVEAQVTPGDLVKMRAGCLETQAALQKEDPAKFQRVARCELKANSGADIEACEKL